MKTNRLRQTLKRLIRIIQGIIIIILILAGIASATYGISEIIKVGLTSTELTK